MFRQSDWAEGDSDNHLSQEDNNDIEMPTAPKSGNRKAAEQPEGLRRDLTIEITNLPTDTTKEALMRKIMIAGPFGRIYSIRIGAAFDTSGRPVEVKARIAFISKESAYHFMAYVNDQGISLSGRPMKVAWSSVPVPETIEVSGKDHSRAIVVDGPADMKRDNINNILRKCDVPESEIEMCRFRSTSDATKGAYILFFSYASASAALKRFNGLNIPTVKASYARDPVDTGVKTAPLAGNYQERDTRAKLDIIWGHNEWRIKKDPKALGPHSTSDSDSSDWLKSKNKKIQSRRHSNAGRNTKG